jgi:hypothetical protein
MRRGSCTTAVRAARRFYVTAINGPRVAWLLGPYRTHREALSHVDRGRDLANSVDLWASFYAFGTSSLPADMASKVKGRFGK